MPAMTPGTRAVRSGRDWRRLPEADRLRRIQRRAGDGMYRYQCPRCRRQGLVRAETVIKGGAAVLELYCGSCDYTWRQELPDETPPRRPEE